MLVRLIAVSIFFVISFCIFFAIFRSPYGPLVGRVQFRRPRWRTQNRVFLCLLLVTNTQLGLIRLNKEIGLFKSLVLLNGGITSPPLPEILGGAYSQRF
jgi:hypothetical protein